MKKYNIGIVLSGGAARGFAHLGVLKALNEKGIYPDIISGASAGAIIGAFIAHGKTPDQVYKLLKNKKITDYTKIHLPVSGFFGLEKLTKILKEDIKVKNIEELEKPLYVAVTNLNKGVVEYHNKGPLNEIILASSSIPIIFSPVNINDTLYVDGGLLDNIPIKPLINNCKKIIAVNVLPVQKSGKLDNMIKIAARTFQVSINANVRYVKLKSDLYIEPEGLTKYNIFDTKNTDVLFELGYEYVKKLEIAL